MSIVSNTGPLIALAKVNRLSLLEHLFGEVFVPAVVYRELLGKSGMEADRLDEALATFIHVAQVADPQAGSCCSDPDAGCWRARCGIRWGSR